MRAASLLALALATGCNPEPTTPPEPAESAEVVAARPSSHGDDELEASQPAEAQTAAKPTAEPESPRSLDAKLLGGLARAPEWIGEESHAAIGRHAKGLDAHWRHFQDELGGPMQTWADGHLEQVEGGAVFYPFSGPDFVTAHRLFPRAGHYTLAAMQRAGPPVTLSGLTRRQLAKVLDHYAEVHEAFTRRGFFVTKEMNEDFHGPQLPIFGVTGVLMSFAAREGYRIVDVEPMYISDAGELEVHPGDRSQRSTWNSVRLRMIRADDETPVTLDYVRINLSNRSLSTKPHHTAWLIRAADASAVLKAASHMPQNSNFTTISEVILRRAGQVVQDESGVAYEALLRAHDVALYGAYTRPNNLFRRETQPPLIDAYRHAEGIEPLPFEYGYVKASGSALMVARPRREEPAGAGSPGPVGAAGDAAAPSSER
jgi:hypothetical protein